MKNLKNNLKKDKDGSINNDVAFLDFATILDEYGDTNFYTAIDDSSTIALRCAYNNIKQLECIEIALRVNNTISILKEFNKPSNSDKLLFNSIHANLLYELEQKKETAEKIISEINKIIFEIRNINLL